MANILRGEYVQVPCPIDATGDVNKFQEMLEIKNEAQRIFTRNRLPYLNVVAVAQIRSRRKWKCSWIVKYGYVENVEAPSSKQVRADLLNTALQNTNTLILAKDDSIPGFVVAYGIKACDCPSGFKSQPSSLLSVLNKIKLEDSIKTETEY